MVEGGGGASLKYFALGLLFENVLGLSSKDCQKKCQIIMFYVL